MTHSNTTDVDFTIRGAGIAGLAVADALASRGQRVAIMDTGPAGGGSSGAPLVLMNPATGRRAKLVEHADRCLESAENLLRKVADFSGISFYSKNGVLRPALIESLAKNFQRAPEKYNWPSPDWIRWLEAEQFKHKYPYIGKHHGGLEIPNAFTVEADTFIDQLSTYLRSKGVIQYFNDAYELKENGDHGYRVYPKNSPPFTTRRVVDAIGSSLYKLPEWDFIPSNRIKGQLLDLEFDTPLPLKQSISSMGYFAFIPANPTRLVVGSTYEHHYNSLETTEQGRVSLYEKLERTLPGFCKRTHSSRMWAGERVSLQDHKPVVGAHPEIRNRYLLGGLGSKGMIYSGYLAEQLSMNILDGKPIEPEVSPDRFVDL